MKKRFRTEQEEMCQAIKYRKWYKRIEFFYRGLCVLGLASILLSVIGHVFAIGVITYIAMIAGICIAVLFVLASILVLSIYNHFVGWQAFKQMMQESLYTDKGNWTDTSL